MLKLLIFCVFSAAIPAQTSDLINRARSLAPEFAADQLLRIANSKLITDPKERKALLLEAFEYARNAERPSGVSLRKDVLLEPPVDALRTSTRLGIDRVQLMARALGPLTALDPKAATESALIVSLESSDSTPCSAWSTPEVGPFFTLFPTLISSARGSAREALMAHALAQVQSPFYYAPALEFANNLPSDLKPQALATLASKRPQLEPRGAQRTLLWMQSPEGLLTFYDADLARSLDQLWAAMERDSTCDQSEWKARVKEALSWLESKEPNKREIAMSMLQPDLRQKPLETLRVQGLQELSQQLTSLLIDGKGLVTSQQERRGDAWKGRLQQVLTKAAQWQPASNDDRTAFFHWKCDFYVSAIILLDPIGDADPIYREFAQYLAQEARSMDRFEWFGSAWRLISTAATSPQRKSALQVLREGPDPTLAAYAELLEALESPGFIN